MSKTPPHPHRHYEEVNRLRSQVAKITSQNRLLEERLKDTRDTSNSYYQAYIATVRALRNVLKGELDAETLRVIALAHQRDEEFDLSKFKTPPT